MHCREIRMIREKCWEKVFKVFSHISFSKRSTDYRISLRYSIARAKFKKNNPKYILQNIYAWNCCFRVPILSFTHRYRYNYYRYRPCAYVCTVWVQRELSEDEDDGDNDDQDNATFDLKRASPSVAQHHVDKFALLQGQVRGKCVYNTYTRARTQVSLRFPHSIHVINMFTVLLVNHWNVCYQFGTHVQRATYAQF